VLERAVQAIVTERTEDAQGTELSKGPGHEPRRDPDPRNDPGVRRSRSNPQLLVTAKRSEFQAKRVSRYVSTYGCFSRCLGDWWWCGGLDVRAYCGRAWPPRARVGARQSLRQENPDVWRRALQFH